ncbi:MAG: 3-isopropylmalate dehydratase large subunit [Gammaproteobacteria bacterium]|nr:MAG: 3-isopropylmalate dehydratase large subunit [Gammaproteobacteria bacterium]
MPRTLYDKLWDLHEVTQREDGTYLLYIDRHLIHEVTSPQAFEGLRLAGRKPWRTSSNKATPDHNIPTTDRQLGLKGIKDEVSKLQVTTLDDNCKEHGIEQFDIEDERQGIVHVVGPEQGITLPGMTVVCGDSHTSTHGALGSLAMGIGTSEVEHVLATQCLVATKQKNMNVQINNVLPKGVYSKDLTMSVIGKIGTAGATGYAIEYSGQAIESMSIEARMTVCNMAIEAGARAGMVAFDEITLDYVKGKPYAPSGTQWDNAIDLWKDLKTDLGAHFDETIKFDASELKPQVSWGTSPEMVIDIDSVVPEPKSNSESSALDYMGLKTGMKPEDIKLDQVFIGSCTNSRLEDLRIAAEIVKGNKVSKSLKRAIVVPGSGLVSKAAIEEGLDQVFMEAGFEWRAPGCSMCLGMNPDQLDEGDHCASTSNRNFEGRQGYKGRTHLVSPATAAAAAIAGNFVDVRSIVG